MSNILMIFHGCPFNAHNSCFSLTNKLDQALWNAEGQWRLRTLCHAASAVATITWVACAQK